MGNSYQRQGKIPGFYKALVSLQLEYCIQVCNPYLKQDMEKLEKLQRRATKLIQG